MDIIILENDLYQLIPINKEMLEGIIITSEIDCFELCDILRLKLAGYVESINLYMMKNGGGIFVGCIC